MALTTNINLLIRTTHTNPLDLSTPTDSMVKNYVSNLSTGISTGKADVTWSDRRTVNSGANDDIDLSGSLLDAFGNVVVLELIKAIYIENRSASNEMVVGNAGSNPWEGWTTVSGSTFVIPPSGYVNLFSSSVDAYAGVVDGDSDIFRVHNAGATAATYDIIIVGCSSNSSIT